MPYTNKDYFLLKISNDELFKLTDDNDDILHGAINSADSMINSYLRNVVEIETFFFPAEGGNEIPDMTPDESWNGPAMIKQCSYDIAMFYLHDRIQYSEIPGWVKDKYNAAIDYLTKVAKGIISLDIDSEKPTSPYYIKPDDNIEYFGSDLIMGRNSF